MYAATGFPDTASVGADAQVGAMVVVVVGAIVVEVVEVVEVGTDVVEVVEVVVAVVVVEHAIEAASACGALLTANETGKRRANITRARCRPGIWHTSNPVATSAIATIHRDDPRPVTGMEQGELDTRTSFGRKHNYTNGLQVKQGHRRTRAHRNIHVR